MYEFDNGLNVRFLCNEYLSCQADYYLTSKLNV